MEEIRAIRVFRGWLSGEGAWSHPDEIHQDIENEEKLVAELKAKTGEFRIHDRMAELHAADDPHAP